MVVSDRNAPHLKKTDEGGYMRDIIQYYGLEELSVVIS